MNISISETTIESQTESSLSSDSNTRSLPSIIDLKYFDNLPNRHSIIYGNNEEDHFWDFDVGDVNGDGEVDFIFGALDADGSDNNRDGCGEVYIIYGPINFSKALDLSLSNVDVIIYGKDEGDGMADVYIGDINGDTIQDLIIGAQWGCGPNNEEDFYGEFSIIYGSNSLPSIIDLKYSQPDVIIYGAEIRDGFAVRASIDDINKDNIDDLILTSIDGDGVDNNRNGCGEVFIIFGKNNLPSIINLNTTKADVTIYGKDIGDKLGFSVITADVTGDDYLDIIIGAPWSDYHNNEISNSGEVYIIKGRETFPSVIDLNVTDSETIIYSTKHENWFGIFLNTGDLNEDGREDLIFTAFGDGINNDREYCGEIYILYGKQTLDSLIEIEQQADIIIYGQEENDGLYYAFIDDINNDNKNDIIASAPRADGPSNSRLNCGEIYIIYGNNNFPSDIDLSTYQSDVIIYGADTNDSVGNSIITDDFNTKGSNDIFLISDGGDGPDNKKIDCGEMYLIYGEEDKIYTESVKLTNGNGEMNKTCFAKCKYYNFQVNASDSKGYQDIESVSLYLDYSGQNIQYSWDKKSNIIWEKYDPNNYAILDPSSNSYSLSQNKFIINFNIIFDWDYPDEDYHGIKVICESETLPSHSFNTSSYFYRVENDLDLIGNLTVVGEYQGMLRHNDWVKGGEMITWQGLKVVYEGTNTSFPPDNEGIQVTVWNSEGLLERDEFNSGEEISIMTMAGMVSKLNEIYIINITGIPRYCDKSDIGYTLNIDTDSITFSNPSYIEGKWETSNYLTCRININDEKGSGLNLSTIEYCTRINDETKWSDWELVTEIEQNGDFYLCLVNFTYSEEKYIYIKWRGKDNVGNGYNESEEYRINITVDDSNKNDDDDTNQLMAVIELTIFVFILIVIIAFLFIKRNKKKNG